MITVECYCRGVKNCLIQLQFIYLIISLIYRLDELEKKEVTDKDRESETEEKEKKKEDEDGEEEGDKEDYEDEDLDEEMDDGTDYNLNYFDNGESYEDEDDNLDDGPTY